MESFSVAFVEVLLRTLQPNLSKLFFSWKTVAHNTSGPILTAWVRSWTAPSRICSIVTYSNRRRMES